MRASVRDGLVEIHDRITTVRGHDADLFDLEDRFNLDRRASGELREAERKLAALQVRSPGAGTFLVPQAEALTQVLEPGHQIGAVQAEATPVLHHPQPFAGAIEVGVQQAMHRLLLIGCRTGHR